MGLIEDVRGLEQGGIFSSDIYKIYNNEQAEVSQNSYLGIKIYDQCISLISLADDYDVSLTSNSLVNINNLLYLTEIFGTKTDVEFVPEKTKLVNFALSFSIDDAEESSFLKLYDKSITLISMADHLGVILCFKHGKLNEYNFCSWG